jgi:hypothetical protein
MYVKQFPTLSKKRFYPLAKKFHNKSSIYFCIDNIQSAKGPFSGVTKSKKSLHIAFWSHSLSLLQILIQKTTWAHSYTQTFSFLNKSTLIIIFKKIFYQRWFCYVIWSKIIIRIIISIENKFLSETK